MRFQKHLVLAFGLFLAATSSGLAASGETTLRGQLSPYDMTLSGKALLGDRSLYASVSGQGSAGPVAFLSYTRENRCVEWDSRYYATNPCLQEKVFWVPTYAVSFNYSVTSQVGSTTSAFAGLDMARLSKSCIENLEEVTIESPHRPTQAPVGVRLAADCRALALVDAAHTANFQELDNSSVKLTHRLVFDVKIKEGVPTEVTMPDSYQGIHLEGDHRRTGEPMFLRHAIIILTK